MLGLFPAQSVRGMMWFGRQSTVELHISEAGCLSAALVRGIRNCPDTPLARRSAEFEVKVGGLRSGPAPMLRVSGR